MKKKKKTKRVVSFRSPVDRVRAFFLSVRVSQSVLMGRKRRVVNGQSVKNNEEDEDEEDEEDDDGCRRAPMDDG